MRDITTEVLKRFSDSWLETEISFDDLINNHGFKRFTALRELIFKLKQDGEFKFFRINRSMNGLVLSRSVNSQLRKDQKFINIEAGENNFKVTLRDGNHVYRDYVIENLRDNKLAKLLKTLKDTLVD